MSFANKYNKGGIKWNINTEGFKYHNLLELSKNETYRIYGFYINTKTKFGAYPVAILCDGFLNLPQHTLTTVKDMLQDPETVEMIKSGKCGLQVEEYVSAKYNKELLSVKWVDM